MVLAGIIFKLSSGNVPKASDIYWQDFVAKKFAHVIVYGILAILIYRALVAGGTAKKRAIIWAVLLATLYGVSDEFHQHYTQGRESKIRDVGFDGLGAVFAIFFTTKILPKLPSEFVEFGKKLEII
jgi:VanZ family protein